MQSLDRALSAAGFFLICLVVLAAPWFFGAWEMWWFWPFMVCIYAVTALLAGRVLLGGLPAGAGSWGPAARGGAAAYLAFLAYAYARFLQAEVYMDAERSLLLFLSPALLGGAIAFGLGRRQLAALSALTAVNLSALCLYGLVNHFVTGSLKVLWQPGYAQYTVDHRATGTYFCPDHFSGVMELAFGVGLALILAREPRLHTRVLAALLMAISAWAVILSKSRGGGMALVVIAAMGFALGFSQWPARARRALMAAALAAALLAGVATAVAGRGYVARFKDYPWTKIEYSDRYQMAAAAIRAWRTSPWVGIGPGMHRNLWPHFAASDPGDRAKGVWPRHPNYTFHSYEVHNDWVQLLEEYGVIGLALFAAAAAAVLRIVWRGRREALARMRGGGEQTPHYWTFLAAFFGAGAMAFHSLGDFNLQMPATVWLLAALLCVPIGHIVRAGGRE